MAEFKRFNLDNLEDLRRTLRDLNLELPLSEKIGILGEKVVSGKIVLPNRFVVQPMEGVDADERSAGPSELTLRRYRRYAEGGAGLIWFEAVVVEPEGQSNSRQLLITPENLDAWKRLVDETRNAARKKWGHEIITVIQISHSGRWSKPFGTPRPLVIQHNPELDKVQNLTGTEPLVSDSELDRIRDLHISSAALAFQAGFDGVEMKAVHGYFAAETLCARRRDGKYGGSYENRTRFVRECTQGIYSQRVPGKFVTARLTMREPSAYPYGWGVEEKEGSLKPDLSEPLRFARELRDMAEMPVFNFSLGYPRYAPYMNRPFDNPIKGGAMPPEHPLEGVVRFQQVGRQLQSHLNTTPVVTAALSWLRDLMPPVAAGLVKEGWVQLIGLGRQSFAYPEAPGEIIQGGRMDRTRCCLTCSLCSQIMKDGKGANGCPVRDGKIYKAELKKGRDAAVFKGSV